MRGHAIGIERIIIIENDVGAIPLPAASGAPISTLKAGSARTLDSDIAKARAAMAVLMQFVIAVGPMNNRRGRFK